MFSALRGAKLQFEASTQMQAEAEALRLICLAGGAAPAWKAAQARGANPRVLHVLEGAEPLLKAAAPAASTVSGAAVVGPTTSSAWTAIEGALRTTSVFDAVMTEAMEAPFNVRVGMLTSQLTGGKVAEGAAKPGQTLAFGANALTPEKLVSIIAVTTEFLDAMPTAMESLITQLKVAVGSAADAEFLGDIASTNAEASTGELPTLTGILNDVILVLLTMIDYNQASRLFLVVAPDQARAMTIAAMGAGIATMGPMGGQFAGLRTLVSDALPTGTISLIDASALAMASTPIEIRTSRQAALELSTTASQASAPTVTQAQLTSMFQTNSVALLAERSIAFAPLRPNAFASLSNVTWGVSGESPLP